MRLRDVLGPDGKPSLYRREWAETSDPLVAEARAQTLAIQRLEVWLRLAYSVLAFGFLLGYWGFYAKGGTAFGVIGVVLSLLALLCVMVLRTGISHGRANVLAMLENLQERSQTENS